MNAGAGAARGGSPVLALTSDGGLPQYGLSSIHAYRFNAQRYQMLI